MVAVTVEPTAAVTASVAAKYGRLSVYFPPTTSTVMVSSVVRPASEAVTVHSPSRGSVVVKLPPATVPVMVLWPSVMVKALPAVVVTVSFGSVLPSTLSSASCMLDAEMPRVSS